MRRSERSRDDAAAPVQIVSIEREAGSGRIQYASACGQGYGLLRSERLPAAGWEVVVDSIRGDGSVIGVLDRSPLQSGQAFYRLEAIEIR